MSEIHTLRLAALATAMAVLLATGCTSETPQSQLASAKAYLAKDDTKSAVIELKNALQKDPNLAEARFLLGKLELAGGDPVSAERDLRRAYELQYPVDDVGPPYARALLDTGEFKKLIEQFASKEIGNAKGAADLATSIGNAHLWLGQREPAAAAFAKALSAVPEYGPAFLGEARLTAVSGDIPGALAKIDRALAASPKLVDAWQFKGDLLLAQRKPDDAMTAYRQALAVRSSYYPAMVALVGVYLQQGKVDEAAQQLATLQKILPKHPQTQYLQALVAHRQGKLPAARDAIQQALAAAPNNIPSLLLQAAIAFDMQSFALAETNLQKVLDRSPDNMYARRLLMATYLRQAQPRKALEVARPVLNKIDRDAPTLALVGEAYLQNRQSAEATRYYAKATALDPTSTRNRAALAISHIAGGSLDQGLRELEAAAAADPGTRADLALIGAAVRGGKYDTALAASEALEKKAPNSPVSHAARGTALLAKREVAEARKSFERAIELDPTYVPAAINLASLDLAEKKPAEARKRFDDILAKDPKNVVALLALAQLTAQSGGSQSEVVALLERAVAGSPLAINARLALVNYLIQTKQFAKAVEAARDADAKIPDNAEIVQALGVAQMGAGDANQAVTTFTRQTRLQPSSTTALMRLAEAQSHSGDKPGALVTLRKVLDLDPNVVQASRGIASIELAAGRPDAAMAIAKDLQKRRPADAGGYMLEGDIQAARKSWPEAATAYQTGAKKTGVTELAAKATMALGAAGRGSDAKTYSETWLKEHPGDGAYRLFLAERALSEKDFATALAHYKLLLDKQPNNATLLNNVAWTSAQLNDPKAIEYAEKANSLAPGQPSFMDTLGMLLVDKGDTARGIELLRKAAALPPQSPNIRLNLAKALIKAGQKDAAKKELTDLQKLGTGFARQAEVTSLLGTL